MVGVKGLTPDDYVCIIVSHSFSIASTRSGSNDIFHMADFGNLAFLHDYGRTSP